MKPLKGSIDKVVLAVYSGAILFVVHPLCTIAMGLVPLIPYPHVPSALMPDMMGVMVRALPMILAGVSITGDLAVAWRMPISTPSFIHLLIWVSVFTRKEVRVNLLLSIRPFCA